MSQLVVEVEDETYHINAVILGVEGKQIVSDQVSLLVEPLDGEDKSLLLNLLHL